MRNPQLWCEVSMKTLSTAFCLAVSLSAGCGQGPSAGDTGAVAETRGALSVAAADPAAHDLALARAGGNAASVEIRPFVSRPATPEEVQAHRADVTASRKAAIDAIAHETRP